MISLRYLPHRLVYFKAWLPAGGSALESWEAWLGQMNLGESL